MASGQGVFDESEEAAVAFETLDIGHQVARVVPFRPSLLPQIVAHQAGAHGVLVDVEESA